MTIYLISTSDMAGDRGNDLLRLLDTVQQNVARCDKNFKLMILLQNCSTEKYKQLSRSVPKFCLLKSIPWRCSLSAARNLLLEEIFAQDNLDDSDIFGFPDDDCFFSPLFFHFLARLFDECRNIGVFFCRCSLRPEEAGFTKDDIKVATFPQIVRLSSSNNVFYRGSLVKTVGLFDPDLGLGTPIGGSEDTDYAIRASLRAGSAAFVDRVLVGHPEPGRVYAAKYFQGSLIVLARYANQNPRLALEFFRKILVGVVFSIKGAISFRLFVSSVILAVRGRGSALKPTGATV